VGKYLSAYKDGTERSRMLAFKLQMLVNHPEESIQHSVHGESLNSRMYLLSVALHDKKSC
jgi:hypothetical protein